MNDSLTPDGTAGRVPDSSRTVKSGFLVKAELLADSDQTAGLEPTSDGTLARPAGSPAAAAEALPGAHIGEYEVVRELGRGTMGVVYHATQTGLNRPVALKMLIGGGFADPEARARFLLEAESVAAIEHANVVKVFTFGECNGHLFIAMEYLPGGTLADRVRKGGPVPAAEVAKIVAQLAAAVAHAHAKGVVHRDIKPANVLLATDGSVRLTDFGLAKMGRSDLTATGAVLGTPSYMSPEQAAGKVREVGTPADVYALGAVLYDLLTGAPPFRAESVAGTIQLVLTADLVAPRELNPTIPRDLEVICRKCLERDPARRYSTAQALADDLQRYIAGEPIQARPPSVGTAARSWARQHFGGLGWALVGGVAVGLVCSCLTWAEAVGRKLQRAHDVYALFPSERTPRVLAYPISDLAMTAIELSAFVAVVVLLFLFAALVRAKNRSADLAAGLIAGTCTSVTFFATSFGWWAVLSTALVPAKAELDLIAANDAELIKRHPDLAKMTPEQRREAVVAKAYFDINLAIPKGVLKGLVLSVALLVPGTVALYALAGRALRRGSTLTALARYAELAVPIIAFHKYGFILGQRVVLYDGMSPEHPEVYGVLLIQSVLIVLAAVRGWPLWLRVPLFLDWFAFYVITNLYALYEF
jgi:predicted Ser/Thr protein kinase